MATRGESKVMIDDTIEMPAMQEVIKTERRTRQTKAEETVIQNAEEPVNCLRNERIIVRFVPRPTVMVQNPKHILYGGMAENATVTYVVPKLSTGIFKNVLTDDEKNCLEKAMGLEYNALSIYKKQNNFWDDSNDTGIGRVILHKQDNYLDLSVPEDYIRYKILLANKDFVAPSLKELEDHPKATYKFVIISENAEAKVTQSNLSATMQCYKEFGKIEDNEDVLRTLVYLLEGRPVSSKTKKEYLQSKVNDYIQSKPRLFLSIVTDKLLPTKALIMKCVEKGLIGKKNDCYYLREDNTPLCEMNEESTLSNAARYLNAPKHQELLFMLQAKAKE